VREKTAITLSHSLLSITIFHSLLSITSIHGLLWHCSWLNHIYLTGRLVRVKKERMLAGYHRCFWGLLRVDIIGAPSGWRNLTTFEEAVAKSTPLSSCSW
jgi:hypothetical protein